jgi:hypothetical protein
VRVSYLVEDVAVLAALELEGAVVVQDHYVVQRDDGSFGGEGGQIVDDEAEVDGELVVWITENADYSEIVFRWFGLFLEALEYAADVDRLLS